jgi:hypothetical protein
MTILDKSISSYPSLPKPFHLLPWTSDGNVLGQIH